MFWKRVQKEKQCGKLWSQLLLINIHDKNGQFFLIKIHAACSTCHPRGSAFQFPWHIILLEVSGDVRLTIIWKRDCPTLSQCSSRSLCGGQVHERETSLILTVTFPNENSAPQRQKHQRFLRFSSQGPHSCIYCRSVLIHWHRADKCLLYICLVFKLKFFMTALSWVSGNFSFSFLSH